MDKLNDLKESAIDTLKLRLGDPIIGSYLVSFIIFNWQVFLLVFSDIVVETKILKIQKILNPSWNTSTILEFLISFLSHPFIAPILFSTIYLFILPKILRPAHKFIYEKKVQSENDRYDAEIKLTPTMLRIGQLETQIQNEIKRVNDLENLRNSHDETIKLLKKENSQLNETIKNLQTGSNFQEDSISSIKQALENENLTLIFDELAEIITASNLLIQSTVARNNRKEITKLNSLNLIERKKDGPNEYWTLTKTGKLLQAKV